MFGFEKLMVWQKALSFTKEIYMVTKGFPADEMFGVTSQIRRAAVSVVLNIAEGAGRKSKKEFKHFLSMSYGSLCETTTLLRLSLELNYIEEVKHKTLYSDADGIGRMITGLSNSNKIPDSRL
ncbi:MAG: hypothetical protein A2X34_05155 [Elusimicrobia bacterium GWC2_51_8]|nr:MAG: hypothetical protein A2X33_04755 [Elusimicrobia bacterium GWA2_51_34]OGR58429.1 MAG: hypothetical protein A2X34_05155 [Elusimicrobia bacterium GWC2_51_8]HAF96114.1 four helix bundle protein [Elusimicrobiota bacterium]HCE97460.1 four helix bundle protein [Elusimicrobiota bacterium]